MESLKASGMSHVSGRELDIPATTMRMSAPGAPDPGMEDTHGEKGDTLELTNRLSLPTLRTWSRKESGAASEHRAQKKEKVAVKSTPATKTPSPDNGIYANANGTLTVLDTHEKPATRETVFDRIVHIEPVIVQEIPRVPPPRCDAVKGLTKGYLEVNGKALL